MNKISDRIESLQPFLHYGPDYRRGVADALQDARLFFGRGEPEAGEHYLLLAELRAEMILIETFEASDPFGPARNAATT
ncbi:MAG: hypothetical protein ACYDEY_15965 [Acidimicrobiales bacterium]